MNNRIPAAGAALLLVGAAIAGCSTGGGGGDATSDDWTLPTEDPTATIHVAGIMSEEQWAPILEAFNAEHPTITVVPDQTPFDSLDSVLQTRITSKTGDPDVYWANMPNIPAQVARGYPADLTDQLGPYTDNFLSAAIEATTVDGRIYGLPIAQSTQMLFYNKDLLAAAGVAEPSADPEARSTWEDVEAGAKSALAAGAEYGLAFEQYNYYQLQPLPMELGGSAGATGDGNLTPDVNSPEWVDAYTWFGNLYEQGISPRGVPATQVSTLFAAGSLAYMVGGPWNLDVLSAGSDVDWGVALQPTFADATEAVTPTGSWALSINDFSKNKEAAAIFVKWMASDDGYVLNATQTELPATTTAQDAYFAREVFGTDEGKKAETIIAYETANTAVNRVQTVGFIEFDNILTSAYSDIINGSPVQDVLDKAQADIEEAWKAYKN